MNIQDIAESALEKMKAQGFDQAQVSADFDQQDELNIAHDEASLFRSTEDFTLVLTGILDGRKASTDVSDPTGDAITATIKSLYERAQVAPQDDANVVSAGETGHIVQGPQSGDLTALTRAVQEILDFRAKETPRMHLEEGQAVYGLSDSILLTSEGTRLTSKVGCYALTAMGTASENGEASSFNYTGGNTNSLGDRPAQDYFNIADMLKETEHQIITKPFDGNFTGDVVMAPHAVSDLLGWFLGQLSDMQLVADSSLYKNKVGEVIASPLLNISSNFDGAGQIAFSSDGFVAEPLDVLSEGKLNMLLPSLYGSRKTGLKHVPCGSGWRVHPGDTPKSELIGAVKKGALVSRLSMGRPGPNGDFSGVIKNSFAIADGKIGQALSETMISGNMAAMLKDIVAISAEHLDTGSSDLPWIQISGLHFS